MSDEVGNAIVAHCKGALKRGIPTNGGKRDADPSIRAPFMKALGHLINSPYCGRDEKGVFHCVCGKCKLTDSGIGHDGNNSGNNCSNSSNGRNYSGDNKPL